MKYPAIRTVTCKCDACGDLLREDHLEDITALYDTISGMVVCDVCQDDFANSAKVYGSTVNWDDIPENRLDYDEREYEPDYDND